MEKYDHPDPPARLWHIGRCSEIREKLARCGPDIMIRRQLIDALDEEKWKRSWAC